MPVPGYSSVVWSRWKITKIRSKSLGAIPADVRAMNVDFLAAGSQKWLLGPLGAAQRLHALVEVPLAAVGHA